MKRWHWLTLVAFVLLGLAMWSWQSDLFNTEVTTIAPDHAILPDKVAGPVPAARQAEIKKMYREPRKMEIPEKPEISSACRSLWSSLMALDLIEIDKLPLLGGCEPPTDLANYQKNYREACLEKKDTKACYSAAFFYRAYVTEFLTRDQRIDQISDTKILLDKLFAKFLTNPISAAEVADRMVELLPDYYPAAQAAVFSRLLDLLKGDLKPNPDSAEFKRVADGLEKLRQMNPDDPQNVELDLFMASLKQDSAQQVKDLTAAFEKGSANPAVTAYYIAREQYKLGNAEAGAQWFAKARELAPNDQRMKETADKIKANPNFYKSKNEKERAVFTATFTFNLQSPDLE